MECRINYDAIRRLLVTASMFAMIKALPAQSNINFIDNDLGKAIELAMSEDKLIFIDGYATWCMPCKLMDEEVFSHENVLTFFNNEFINVKLDLEKGLGPILAARYNAQVLPAYFFLTSDETLVHQCEGFQGVTDLLLHAQSALDPANQRAAVNARYDQGGRKPDFLYNYAFRKQQEGDPAYETIVDEYLGTQTEWSSPKNMKFIYHFVDDAYSPMFAHIADNREVYEKMFGHEDLDRTMTFLVHAAIQNREGTMTAEEVAHLFIRANPSRGKSLGLEYRMARYKLEGSVDGMADDIYSSLKTGTRVSPDSLLAYNHYLLLEKADAHSLMTALSWTRQIKASSSDSEVSRSLSKLYQATGQTKLALKTLKKAIRKARKQDDQLGVHQLQKEFTEMRVSR